MTGIRSWIFAMRSFGGQVAMADVASFFRLSRGFMDQIPAKAKGRPDLIRTKKGVLLRPLFFLHS